MSDYGTFGVSAQRKEHPAIKGANEDTKGIPGAVGAADARVDGQRLYLGRGSGGMGGAKRTKSDQGPGVSRIKVGSFKIRKRSVK